MKNLLLRWRLAAFLTMVIDPSRSFRMTTDAFLTMTPCRPLSFWTEARMPCGKDGKRNSGTEWRIYYLEWHLTGFLTTAIDPSHSFRMTTDAFLTMTPCRPLSFWTEARMPCGNDRKRNSGTEWRIYYLEWRLTVFLTMAIDPSRSLGMTINISLIMTSCRSPVILNGSKNALWERRKTE